VDGDLSDKPKYSLLYRDPEIDFDETRGICRPINVKVELYAIGIVIAELSQKGISRKDEEHPFFHLKQYQNLSISEQEIVHDLTRYPVGERLSIEQILVKYPELRFTTGTVIETPVLPMDRKCDQVVLTELLDWVYDKVFIKFRTNTVKTLFNAFHMIHRSIYKVVPNYDDQKKSKYRLCASVCVMLSQMTLTENQHLHIESFVSLYTEQEVIEMIIDVMTSLRGIILTPTAWDYSESVEDLYQNFIDLCCCDYNPLEVRPPSNEASKHTKHTTISNFKQGLKYHIKTDLPNAIANNIKSIMVTPQIRATPISISLLSDIKPIYNFNLLKKVINDYNRGIGGNFKGVYLNIEVFKVLDQITDPDELFTIKTLLQDSPIGRNIVRYCPHV
jgi:hypothetical protein